MPVPARVQRWWPQIQQYAAKYGVPAELLAAIVEFESGGDPQAGHKVSGATGLGQVMPREAGFRDRPSRQELLDPDTNLDWSARILADGYKRWGTPQQAAAAYLGALDRKGNITNAADANGTTGHSYVARIMKTLEGSGDWAASGPGVGLRDGGVGAAIAGGVPGGRLLTDAAALMKLGLPDPMSLWQRGGRSAGGATGQGVSGRRWPVDQPPSTNAGFGVPQTITGGYGNVFGAKPHNAQNQPLNTGMDVTAAAGATIYPVTPGEIVEVKRFNPAEKASGRDSTGGYGNSVVVRGDDGLLYRYSHMRDQSQFQVGQRTPDGQPLGAVGATGNATGPHLDLEITDAQGNYLDGGALIRGDAQVTRLPPRGQPDPGPWQNQPIRGAQLLSSPAGGQSGAQGGTVAFPVKGYKGQVSVHWGSDDPGARGGADLMAPEGTPVVSMVPGTVEWASTEPIGGNNVGIRGDDGRIYYYAHLRDAPQVRQGQRVEGDQVIGAVGRTGNAKGGPAHLHIGIGETEITKGAGPLAGLGANFDATSYLQSVLAGQSQWQGAGTQPGFQLMSNPRSRASGPMAQMAQPPADGPDPAAVWLQKMGGQMIQGQQGLGGVRGASIQASTMGAGPATPPADGPDPAAIWQQLGTPASHNAGTPTPSTAQERQLMAGEPGTATPGGGKYPWDPGGHWPWEQAPGATPAPPPNQVYPWDGKLPWMQPPAPAAPTAPAPGTAAPSAGDTGAAGAVYDYSRFAPQDGDSPRLRVAKAAAERAQRAYDTELAKIEAGEAAIAAAEKAKLTIPSQIGPSARATTPKEVLAAYDAIKRRAALSDPENAEFKRMDALKKAVGDALKAVGDAETTNPADAAGAAGRPAPGSAEERARGGNGQGAGPTGQGGPVHTIDVGRYVYLYDDKGQWLGAWPKQEGNKPEFIGSTTGPKVLRYNPATDTAEWVDNPAYTNKRSAVTTGDDVQYLVYEDEQGHKTVEANPNYNPWSAANTTEGKGIAEGKVSHITRDGQVVTRDTLLPEERALLTRGEEARIGGVEATTAKTTAEAAALKRKEDNWKQIEAAWQAGASMEEINGLVLQSAQDVDDFVKLQAEDRARQTQAETQRNNLATEELTRQQRRKEDVAQYGTAMESYGRFGVASAPWQTSVLAAAAPLQGVGAAAKGMNIDPNAPWAQGIQKQYDDYTNRQANTAGAARQAFETSGRSMFGDRGNQVNSGAGGNYGTTQKPPPQATGAWTPPGQAGPGASGTYVNQTQSEPAPAQDAGSANGTGGTGGTGASYGGENPAQPAGAGRTPVQGQDALDLGDPAIASQYGMDVQPGKALTVYQNGEREVWDINAGGGWLPQSTGVYGTGGGGDESGKPIYSQGRRLARRRSPVPGKQAVDMGDGKHVVTHYDDGSKEVWALDGSGPSWEGVGGGGSGYWFDRPTTYGVGHTGGGGASVWQLPPGATVSMAQGLAPGQTPTAQQVQPQQQPLAPQSGVAPYQPQPVTGLGDKTTTARFPTTMSGGYGGPAATPGQGGGGGGGFRYRDRIGKAHQRGKGGGAAPGMPGFPDPTAMGVGMSAMPPGAEPFLPPGAQGAPPAGPPEPLTYGAGGAYMGGGGAGAGNGMGQARPYQAGNTPAPMWDAALGAGGRNMTMGPGGRQGSATLYSRPGGGGISSGPGGGGSGGARGGTNYGGPTAPAAITPLQRLMEQSGLVPRMAGQAAGSPGGI